tara:strand:- start:4628 stop:5119 length:492 start_codon:yes stop_codon:yes gene_type:complete
MTNKIWYKLVDLKYGECYLTRYISLQRNLKRGFKIATLILSLGGILGWKYFEEYVWIALIIISIIQIFTLIENQLIRSDKEIEEISALRMMYSKYFNKLEKFWTQYYNENINKNEAINKFYKFQENDWQKIEELDCKLNIKEYSKMMNKADVQTNNYLNKYLL